MTRRLNQVVITGIGPVTAVGVGRDAVWTALTQGRTNVTMRSLQFDVAQVAEVPMASMPPAADVPGLETHLSYLASQDAEGHRDLAYALLATELAIADAGLEYDRDSNRIGAIQVFEAPGVEKAVGRLFQLFQSGPPTAGPPPVYDLLSPCFYNMQPFVYVHLLGKAMGFRGYSTSVHNACTSGAFAIELAAHRIRSGQADVMVVVGGEAFDTAVRLEWFRRLDLYAKTDQMRPFDGESSGFYVGEGAGAMVLESAEHAMHRGATPYAQYLGGAFSHQGWKQVIPDVRAARLRETIVQAMRTTRLPAGELDLIIPHGAGTKLSDGYESTCLAQAMTGRRENAVATALKPYFGHMLAASGIIELIGAMLAIKYQCVPPTLNTKPENAHLPVPLATTLLTRPIKTVLKLSTGFTGHDAASLFRAV